MLHVCYRPSARRKVALYGFKVHEKCDDLKRCICRPVEDDRKVRLAVAPSGIECESKPSSSFKASSPPLRTGMVEPQKRNHRAASDVLKPPDHPVSLQNVTVQPSARAASGVVWECIERDSSSRRTSTIETGSLFQRLTLPNEAQTISTLPNELLVYIFQLSQATADALDAGNWLGRLYICRHWYQLITSTAHFWRDIYVSSRPEWLELCLSRRAGMLVDVHFAGRFSLVYMTSVFMKHALSIRGIIYTVLRSSWQTDIAQLLSMPLPSLQKLDISMTTMSPQRAWVALREANVLGLNTLKLRSCYVPSNPAVYSSLSSLDIGECSWIMNFEHLLNALASTKNLCELVLHDCFVKWTDVPHSLARTNPPCQSPITLSRLLVLQLTAIPPCVASHFLARISVPNAHHVHIHVECDTRQGRVSVWDVFPAHAAAFSPTCSLATSLRFEIHDRHTGDYSVTARSTDRYMHLSLCGTQDVPSPVWERVFRSYPTLREMNACVCDALLSALKTVSEQQHRACYPELAVRTTSNCCSMSETTCAVSLEPMTLRINDVHY
ncbi:hypothetical protein OH76DRAFT_1420459 [Lentinus brumalis]|uniref:F-box domain-containing protein n=1 Tax=Lentinus brumalis TaxID=2498619 RepID=A0A371D024_9APHY|nr:hypothetical protein OH76DRAFT_1420459 [Polyporus brumalis]